MRFDWDAPKAAANRRKHGVSFEEACTVFANPLAITMSDARHSDDEERELTVGVSNRSRILVVVHTVAMDRVVRIISARRATRQEAHDYAEEIGSRIGQDQE